MIPASEKAKLEEMAIDHDDENSEGYGCGPGASFKFGAQAAWDLCEKYERERIYKDVRKGLRSLSLLLLNAEGRDEKLRTAEHDACLIASGYLEHFILTPPQSDEGSK